MELYDHPFYTLSILHYTSILLKGIDKKSKKSIIDKKILENIRKHALYKLRKAQAPV